MPLKMGIGPSENAFEMAFCWRVECWLGSFVILGHPDQYC